MLYPELLAWQHFVNLPHIRALPVNEQVHRYNYYLMEQEMVIQQVMNAQQAIGSGGTPAVESDLPPEPPLPSNCIQFTANTTEGKEFTFEVDVNGAITYTIDWGDGTVDENVEIEESGEAEISHEYPDLNTEYTATICFSDITQVISIDFWGVD